MSESDVTGAGDRWIPDIEYRAILEAVPIACVDLLPFSRDLSMVGLIWRTTFQGGHGWCLVGGAVLRNEPLVEAVDRHTSSTLSAGAKILRDTLRPAGTFEYLTVHRNGYLYDPRKHAIANCFAGVVEGTLAPQGEAERFEWFPVDRVPRLDEYGFRQGEVVQGVMDSYLGAGHRVPD